MFAWGEDAPRGFWIKSASDLQTEPGIQHLNLGYRVTGLSAAHGALVFVKSNGNSFVIPGSRDGRRAGGKQKFVKGREKIQAACCRDDDNDVGDDVTLLSEKGNVFLVNTRRDNIPRPLQALRNIAVAQVACGSQHSVALTKDGQVFTWGQDSRGQLGLGGRMKSGVGPPELLGCLTSVPLVQVSAGGDQSFAVSVSGGVLGWGRNDHGQLGLGDTADRRAPTPVRCLNMKKTVHVSCGTDHTVVLTKDGAVFTFGSGQYGQLGHNSFRDELRPRLVAELLGAKVTKTACGRHHTLVLTDSNRVYSFGRGEQGQLGRGEESHPSVPLPVQLTHDATNAPQIRSIFAGGNRSYATCTSSEDVAEDQNAESGRPQQRLDDMIDRWSSECDSKSWEKMRQEIRRMFSSASCLNASFLEQSNDKHFQTSAKYSGLDFPLARLAFQKLLKKPEAFAEVEAAVLQLLPRLDKKPLAVEQLRIFLLLNELLHAIQQRGKRKRGKRSIKLAVAGAAAMLRLSAESLQVVGDWWSMLSPSTKQIHVKVWTQVLSVVVFLVPVPRIPGVRNLLVLLQYMYDTNSRTAEPQRLPESSFHLSMDEEFLYEEIKLWYMQRGNEYACDEPLILFNFPTVMDLASKKFVFDQSARSAKELACVAWVMCQEQELDEPEYPDCPSLALWLRRASVLEDTFEQLTDAKRHYYKFPLEVYFNDIFTFDNLNLKDFFYEVFHEMVSAESGMFMFNDAKTLAWFPSKAAQEDQRYYQFGVLCGLALYNQHIVHLPFPLALFKKLLDVKPSLEDMLEFSPCVGESLLNILEKYSEEDIENLFMDFGISWDETEVDLDPGNPEKPVTSENKKEFVEAYISHAFNTSVERVFQDFKRGFYQVCDLNFVKLFRPKELQEVMVGKDFQDWEKLKQNTVYEGVYKTEPPHPIIQMFWEVFDELTGDQKKAFLWFVTGFDMVPIVGVNNFQIKIRNLYVKDGSSDQFYPQSHTCFSGLELPLYSTKEIMQAKLTEVGRNKEQLG